MRRLHGIPDPTMHSALMLTLTFTTGAIDAIGFLGLDRVFTANMTGNIVILGMAIAGADELPVLGPALATVGFVVGAIIGGRVLKRATSPWSGVTTSLFIAVGILTFLAAIPLLQTANDPAHAITVAITTVLAAAMGLQAATARFVAVKDVTTVVITSTITGLAADSRWGNGQATHHVTVRRAVAVGAMAAGACLGAFFVWWSMAAGLICAGVAIVLSACLGALHARRK